MENIFCLFSVLLLSSLVEVNSLQCYVCFNCTTPGADELKTCGEPVTTTQSPTVPTTTGIPTSPSTTIPTITTPSTTTASSTITPITTTTPSTATTPTTTPSTTITSTTAPSTTTTSTTITTTTTEAPVDPPVDSEPEGRWKRNVMSPGYVTRVSQFEDIEYVCYKTTAIKNNETVVERGCLPAAINGKELCENDEIKNVTTSCSTCKTDKCNGSYAVQFSSALLTAAIVGLLFSK